MCWVLGAFSLIVNLILKKIPIEYFEFINYIAGNPSKGALIVGTGGARKIRWTADVNQGKSGGVRVLYYYHNQSVPIFLFTVFGKNKKANITQNERNLLKTIINKIVQAYEENDHE